MAVIGADSGSYTPSDVERKRKFAAMLLQGQQKAKEPFGALAQGLRGALSGWNEYEAGQAEGKGRSAVSELLQSGDYKGALGNEWASPQQSAMASMLQGRDWQQQDQQANWAREDAIRAAEAANPTPADMPATVQEWEYFNALPEDQKAQYLRMKRSTPYLDIGTGFVQPDPVNPGSTAGPEIVKDNFTPAYDAAAGTAEAKVDVETEAAADSLESKLPGLQTVVGELNELAKTATYTQTGQLIDNAMRETGMEPGEAAVARTKYIAMVDNQVLPLLRDTFGAAFTVKEGETLRATLGDPNKAPAEKQAILEAFIEQKARDLEALKSRVPGAGTPAGTGTQDVDEILRGLGL